MAAHKVPSQIVIVDQIPKGPTGKLQRIGLYEKLAARLHPPTALPRVRRKARWPGCGQKCSAHLCRPVRPVWTTISSPWAATFSMRSSSWRGISAVFDVELPVGVIFRHPTIAEQARLVEALILQQLEALEPQDAPDGAAGDAGKQVGRA